MQDDQASRPNLFTRHDTFFGICEGLGADLGVPANLIRMALAGLSFFYPVPVVATYFGLGLVLFAARYFFPDVTGAIAAANSDELAVEESGEAVLPLAA